MRVDVLALQRFYASPLGAVSQRMVARRLGALWPHADGLDVLGVGYAAPWLEPYRKGARRTVLAQPAQQGGERWPAEGPSLAAVSDEARLPFIDAIFDRVLMVHALEESQNLRALLREIWRVMAPEGRLVVVAANRWSWWALSDATPFGQGRPFSRQQLSSVLSEAMFEPLASARALYAPPWRWGAVLKAADAFERVGEVMWPAAGGLVMMEAVKRLYAETARPGQRVLLAKAGQRAGSAPPPRRS